MSFKFFNVVDLQSRQYCFDIETGVKIKTSSKEFDITLDDFNQQKIFDLITEKVVFQVIGKTSNFIVNPENIVGVLYTEN